MAGSVLVIKLVRFVVEILVVDLFVTVAAVGD